MISRSYQQENDIASIEYESKSQLYFIQKKNEAPRVHALVIAANTDSTCLKLV